MYCRTAQLVSASPALPDRLSTSSPRVGATHQLRVGQAARPAGKCGRLVSTAGTAGGQVQPGGKCSGRSRVAKYGRRSQGASAVGGQVRPAPPLASMAGSAGKQVPAEAVAARSRSAAGDLAMASGTEAG